MDASSGHTIEGVDKARGQLEETARKLRKALSHWQLWHAEYDELRAAVAALPADEAEARRGLAKIRRDFADGGVLTRKEATEILGRIDLRPRAQITNQLERRLDYVDRNIATLEKQLADVEIRIAAARDPENLDEEGLPLTEIIEELDDDDNVVSSRLQSMADAKPDILGLLKKAGLDDESVEDGKGKKEPAVEPGSSAKDGAVSGGARAHPGGANPKVAAGSEPAKSPVETTQQKRKHVKFAEKAESRQIESREQGPGQHPPAGGITAHVDESPEEARMRREMLEYGLNEVGAVVAELEILDGSADDSDGDDDVMDLEDLDTFDSEDEEDDSDDDEEDEFGRSMRSALNTEYRNRMLALQQRMSLGMMQRDSAGDSEVNGSNRDSPGSEVRVPGLSPGVPESRSPKASDASARDMTRSVRFADTLDIAPGSTPSTATSGRVKAGSVAFAEPSSPANQAPEPAQPRVSRFKKDRASMASNSATKKPQDVLATAPPAASGGGGNAPDPAPSSHGTQTMVDSLIERETSSAPKVPDELDATLLQQEVATEFHRLRNRQIQREGGFVREEEQERQPLEPEVGGRRVSRFKAAQMNRRIP